MSSVPADLTALGGPRLPVQRASTCPSLAGRPASPVHLGATEQALGTLPLGSAPIALLERILHLAHRAALPALEEEPHHRGRVRAARFVL